MLRNFHISATETEEATATRDLSIIPLHIGCYEMTSCYDSFKPRLIIIFDYFTFSLSHFAFQHLLAAIGFSDHP